MLPESELGREAFYTELRARLVARLEQLEALPVPEPAQRRCARFRALGERQLLEE